MYFNEQKNTLNHQSLTIKYSLLSFQMLLKKSCSVVVQQSTEAAVRQQQVMREILRDPRVCVPAFRGLRALSRRVLPAR